MGFVGLGAGSLQTATRRNETWSQVCAGDHLPGFQTQSCCSDAGSHSWSRTQEAGNQHVSVSVCYLLAALGGNNLHSFKYLIQWFSRDLQLHNQSQRSTLPKRVPPALLQRSFPTHSSSHGKKTRIHNFCAHIWGRMSHACFYSHFQTGTMCQLHVGPVCARRPHISV